MAQWGLDIFTITSLWKALAARPGASLARLGVSSGRLSVILTRLGAILERLGRVLASKNRSKIAPRRLQDASQDEVQHRPQLGSL